MKPRHHPSPSQDAIQARAALEALFGGSGPSPTQQPDHQSLEGKELVAKKAANAQAISSKVDLLRRKREAMQAIQQAAASTGFTLEELREAAAEEENKIT